MISIARPRGGPPTWYLSVVAIFKNEALHLDEWLAFCVSEGVEHVLLYDHCSTDNSKAVLRPWIDAGIVELIEWPVAWKNEAQTKAYLHALGRLRGRTRWAAFIDIDEFLFSPTGETLPRVLKRYEGHAGVVVNWQCYGTSGHEKRPLGLTIESYTQRARTSWARNRRVKTIVDPFLAVTPEGPHLFSLQSGQNLVTEDFVPVRFVRTAKWRRRLRYLTAWLPYLPFDPYSIRVPATNRVSTSHLRINHYATRSKEDLKSKYKDRDAMLNWDRRSYSRYHDRNEVDDPILAPKASRVHGIISRVQGGGGSRAVNG
jgi:hypothetical protein